MQTVSRTCRQYNQDGPSYRHLCRYRSLSAQHDPSHLSDPIRKNGRPWKEDCPAACARDETLRAIRHYGRAFWNRWTGYHVRSRIEAKMRCLKAFGERIAARDPDRQAAEIQIRIALMNHFSALGMAEIVRVA